MSTPPRDPQGQFNHCQNPRTFSVELDCTIHVESERIVVAQSILRENNAGGITLPDFKMCYKGPGITAAWRWQEADA